MDRVPGRIHDRAANLHDLTNRCLHYASEAKVVALLEASGGRGLTTDLHEVFLGNDFTAVAADPKIPRDLIPGVPIVVHGRTNHSELFSDITLCKAVVLRITIGLGLHIGFIRELYFKVGLGDLVGIHRPALTTEPQAVIHMRTLLFAADRLCRIRIRRNGF